MNRAALRLRHALVLLALLASLAVLAAGCKQETPSTEKSDEKPEGTTAEAVEGEEGAAKAEAPARVDAGRAAAAKPVGSTDEQKTLLTEGPGLIDTAIALRMMGTGHPQHLVLRPEPFAGSGLAEAVLGALPPPIRAMYDAGRADLGDIDPMRAVESATFWSDAKTLRGDDGEKSLYFVIVTRDDTLARLAGHLTKLDDDSDDDDKDGTVAEGFVAVAGAVDEKTLATLVDQVEQTKSAAERPYEREDLDPRHVLLVQKHSRQGTNFFYFWPEGAAMGHSNAEGAPLDVGREAAARFVSEVAAARAGSGGEIDPALFLDAELMVEDDKGFDATITIDDKLSASVEVSQAMLGGDGGKAMAGFEKMTQMSGDELGGVVAKMGLPEALAPVAVVALETLELERNKDTVTLRISPTVAAIKEAVPAAH